jgi:hypothetical protein
MRLTTTTTTEDLRCPEAKRLFSPYLDGAVTGLQMHGLERHLSGCAACHSDYESLRHTQQLLVSVGRPKAPTDLGLKLRLAISREAAQARRPPFEGLRVRVENLFNAFSVPATAGFLTALLIFGVVMGYFVVPATLRASNDDVPLLVNTAPELQQSAFGSTLDTINADSLVIEAYIGSDGRVQDYRILSDPDSSKEVLPEVKRMLIFTTFRPAMSMGRPTWGRAVLSFSKISVRG